MFPYQELFEALKSDIASKYPNLDTSGLLSDQSIGEIRCTMLLRSFYKKLAPGGNAEAADEEALKKFELLNNAISTDPFEYPVESEWDSLFWDYFRDNVLKVLTPSDDCVFDLAYMRETLAVGPGASLKHNNESFYTKLFDCRVTATSPYLLALYRAAISESDLWAQAEMQRHKRFGDLIVSGNRLFFVPKTAEISRTCCTEPGINMILQKALGAFLEERLIDSFGISLDRQPDFNRELARRGSLDGSFGTIDLQSASDSISWSLVQRIIPSPIIGFIGAFRSERAIFPDGSERALNMVSTMGNGFTFPLQTLLFACVVRAVYQMMDLPSSSPRDHFGVFGDDIIVRREAYNFVVRGLTKLGFRVNTDKSFNTGPFRESCGYDWYAGHFVRGVYITSLETVSDVYSAVNRLNRWSAMSGVRLQRVMEVLLRDVPEMHVPFSEPFDCGIQVPSSMTELRRNAEHWYTYRKYVYRPKRRAVPECKEGSAALGYEDFNPFGWGVAFLGGYARRGKWSTKPEIEEDQASLFDPVPVAYLTLRELGVAKRLKVVRGSIPWWDWPGPAETEGSDRDLENPYRDLRFFSYSAWESAVTANL